MHIAILTFDGYNELDSLIALGVLNRVGKPGWRVSIATPSPRVRSMNGVVIESRPVSRSVRSGRGRRRHGTQTREVIADPAIMGQLRRSTRHGNCWPGSARGRSCWPNWGCSRTCPPAPTSSPSPGWAAGVEVLNQPFFARGNVATAGGCLASHYLAAWIIARLEGGDAAESALHYVAPVGEKEEYVSRACATSRPTFARASRSGRPGRLGPRRRCGRPGPRPAVAAGQRRSSVEHERGGHPLAGQPREDPAQREQHGERLVDPAADCLRPVGEEPDARRTRR